VFWRDFVGPKAVPAAGRLAKSHGKSHEKPEMSRVKSGVSQTEVCPKN
jgi:hypothetical protein